MSKKSYLFTSESVSEGHPDKVCDRISDMVVDTYLKKEPFSRVACETLTTTNKVVLAGETRGPEIKKDDLIEKVRGCIKDIGYEQKGFHWKNCSIDVHLHSQSSDIAMGVDSKGNKDEGAGDQGIMFGYACDETKDLMPAPIYFSHKILRLMAEDRKKGILKGIEPDSKSQVSMLYEKDKVDIIHKYSDRNVHSLKRDGEINNTLLDCSNEWGDDKSKSKTHEDDSIKFEFEENEYEKEYTEDTKNIQETSISSTLVDIDAMNSINETEFNWDEI